MLHSIRTDDGLLRAGQVGHLLAAFAARRIALQIPRAHGSRRLP